MDLSVEVIDAVRLVAKNLTNDVLQYIPNAPDVNYTHSKHGHKHHYHEEHPNKFQYITHELPDYKLTDSGVQVFCDTRTPHLAIITFEGLAMSKITDMVFETPVVLRKQSIPVNLAQWVAGAEKQVYSYEHSTKETDVETYTSSQDLAVQIAYSLKSKFGVQAGIAAGTVESTYSFQTNFKQKFSHTTTHETQTTDTERSTYTVDPYKVSTLVREKNITDYRQTVHTTGLLDATKIIVDSEYADNQFIPGRRDFYFECESLLELQEYIRGGGTSKYFWTDQFFEGRRFQDYTIDLAACHLTATDEYTYRDVQSTSAEQHDVSITPEEYQEKYGDFGANGGQIF